MHYNYRYNPYSYGILVSGGEKLTSAERIPGYFTPGTGVESWIESDVTTRGYVTLEMYWKGRADWLASFERYGEDARFFYLEPEDAERLAEALKQQAQKAREFLQYRKV
jgi:hypothetical protein